MGSLSRDLSFWSRRPVASVVFHVQNDQTELTACVVCPLPKLWGRESCIFPDTLAGPWKTAWGRETLLTGIQTVGVCEYAKYMQNNNINITIF